MLHISNKKCFAYNEESEMMEHEKEMKAHGYFVTNDQHDIHALYREYEIDINRVGADSSATSKDVTLTLPDKLWDRINVELEFQPAEKNEEQLIRDVLIHFFYPSGKIK